jgi:HK97 family phage major capsid protein
MSVKKTVGEQIADLENTRAAKAARAEEVLTKSIEGGRTTDAAEAEEVDTLNDEIEAIDADLKRLKTLQEFQKAKATPVDGKTTVSASDSRGGISATLKTVEKLEPGIAFARYAMCLFKAKGDHAKAARFAEQYYPNTENVVKTLKAQAEGADLHQIMVTKTTIPAGTTTDSTWAAPLVYANTFTGDFIEYLRPRTLIGQAQFQPIPFNVRIPSQTSGGTAGWVGQSKPVTKFDFNAVSTSYTKIAAITVMTQELMRLSDPSAQAIVRNQLAQAVIARADSDLFDPDLAAVANVNPAGLLNGISPVSVSAIDYGDPATVRCAIAALWAPWDSTFLGMRPAYYTTPAVARQLSLSREALGTQAFPGVTMTGGTLDGIPLRVSQYLANNGGSGGAPFILVDESEVYLADDGNVTVDMSNEATIEMTDAPVGSTSATVTSNGSPFVSMFQTNSTAIRAERWIWWGLRRSGAIQWIDGFPTTC